jgi:hypothetical protein
MTSKSAGAGHRLGAGGCRGHPPGWSRDRLIKGAIYQSCHTSAQTGGVSDLVALRCRDPAACCYETLTGSFRRRADPFTEVTKPSEAL